MATGSTAATAAAAAKKRRRGEEAAGFDYKALSRREFSRTAAPPRDRTLLSLSAVPIPGVLRSLKINGALVSRRRRIQGSVRRRIGESG